jgi:hypothetical protein
MICLKKQLQPFFLSFDAHQRRNVIQGILQLEIHGFHIQFAGFDLGKIQDVVDDAQRDLAEDPSFSDSHIV